MRHFSKCFKINLNCFKIILNCLKIILNCFKIIMNCLKNVWEIYFFKVSSMLNKLLKIFIDPSLFRNLFLIGGKKLFSLHLIYFMRIIEFFNMKSVSFPLYEKKYWTKGEFTTSVSLSQPSRKKRRNSQWFSQNKNTIIVP